MPSRRRKTAAEFVKELEQDEDYQARRREEATRSEALSRVCAQDERPLLAELGAAGVDVESLWDFVNDGGAPEAAVPILVRHLALPHHPRVWDGIVRSLSTRAARNHALEPLRELYRREREPSRRWVVANAIGSMARFAEVQDLEGIAEYRALFRQSRKPPHAPPAT